MILTMENGDFTMEHGDVTMASLQCHQRCLAGKYLSRMEVYCWQNKPTATFEKNWRVAMENAGFMRENGR